MNCYYVLLFLITHLLFTNVINGYLKPEHRQFQVFEQIPNLIPACDQTNAPNHFIYCRGPILEAVMALRLYNDSKTFVDKPLKYAPQEVLDKFNRQFLGVQVTRFELQKFVDENFDAEGTELKSCKLNDWSEKPLALMSIVNKPMREWALKIHQIWKSLCREVDIKVFLNEERYSLIYLPKQFVVPGGRFLEYYYWDGYFISKGLLASGLFGTAKSMIENYVYLVSKYGFIPNGGRSYYLGRSQPPMLIAMLYEYYDKTRDIEFLSKNIDMLEKELKFWDNNRLIKIKLKGQEYELYQYRANTNSPRPESFREDVELVKQMTKNEDKKRVWQNIASAAESGWDFSSRWLRNAHDLSTIQTIDIIPVDLNSFICWNYDILSYLFEEIGNDEKAEEYRLKFGRFRAVFQKVFYVHNESGWFDYNWKNERHNFQFYPSMATPLFTRCYHALNHAQVEAIFQKMDNMGTFKFTGGIPTSLAMNTSQQWDYPNGWSPLNLMIIQGLRQSESSRMHEKSFLLAQKLILNNYRVFQKTNLMWEKYSVVGTVPEEGSGGEYSVQAGFGWTNGVILDLLVTYADRLDFALLEENASNCTDTNCNKFYNSVNPTYVQSIIVTVMCLLLIFVRS